MPTQPYKTKSGKRVPGTTTVIGASLGWNKQQLMHWAHQQGLEGLDFRKTTETAAQAGTIAHAMAEADIKNVPYIPDYGVDINSDTYKKAKAAFEAYLTWKSMSKLELKEAEVAYVSEEYLYGGTIDAIGVVNGKLALIDFKTSGGLYGDHLIQVSAYMNLYESDTLGKTGSLVDSLLDGGVHILRFGKEEGDFHHHHYPRETIQKVFPAFKHLRELYDMKKFVENLT
jgi:hypothetical protein